MRESAGWSAREERTEKGKSFIYIFIFIVIRRFVFLSLSRLIFFIWCWIQRRYFRFFKLYSSQTNSIWWMNSIHAGKIKKPTEASIALCDASAWHKRIQTHMGVPMMILRTQLMYMLCNIFHMLSVCYCSHFYHYLCFTFYCSPTCSVSSIWIWWMRKTHLQIGVIREKENCTYSRLCVYAAYTIIIIGRKRWRRNEYGVEMNRYQHHILWEVRKMASQRKESGRMITRGRENGGRRRRESEWMTFAKKLMYNRHLCIHTS